MKRSVKSNQKWQTVWLSGFVALILACASSPPHRCKLAGSVIDAMEPEVIRIYSSSPPPMDDGTEEEDSEFGDFGAFSAVAASISFTELDTPTTFNQTQALSATSPPELVASRGMLGFSHGTLKANGVAGHHGDAHSDRTESNSVLAGSPDHLVSEAGSRDPEVLTNGFVTFDLQGSPALQNSVHAYRKETSESPEDNFADFASFSEAEGGVACVEAEDTLRDPNRTRTRDSESISAPAEAPDGSCSLDRGLGSPCHTASVCTNRPASLNGLDTAEGDQMVDRSQDDPSPGEREQIHGKSSDSETETSLGRPLSADALKEYVGVSTPDSTTSPPFQEDTTPPADHTQLEEDDGDDEDFGDFGNVTPGFPEFEQEAEREGSREQSSSPTQEQPEDGDDDFGDFNTPQFQSGEHEEEAAEFPVSNSFGNFSSAAEGQEADSAWSAFGEAEPEEGTESWAAFSTEPDICIPAEGREEEEAEEEQTAGRGESSRTTVSHQTLTG